MAKTHGDDLPTICRCLGEIGIDPDNWDALRLWSEAIELVAHRRSLPADAPLLTVLVGPTGAGKSTIFNLILGRTVSQAGAIRPCTIQPLGTGSSAAVAFFRDESYLTQQGIEVDWRDAEGSADLLGAQVFIDAPDFDGVEAENRRVAQGFMRRADRVIVVLSPEKYGDASVWNALNELKRWGSIVGTIFNKDEKQDAREDCERLLASAGLPVPIPVPRLPEPDRPDQAPSDLRTRLTSLVELDTPTPARLSELLTRCEEIEREARRPVSVWLSGQTEQLEAAEAACRALLESLPTRVQQRLPLQLDEALRVQLQNRFVELIQKYDFLREPRRWLMAPFQWVRGWLPGGDDRRAPDVPESSSEWLTDAYRDRYFEFRLHLADEMRAVGQSLQQAAQPQLPWESLPTPTPEACRDELHGVFEALQAEMEQESERIAEGLSMGGKVSFYGSQMVFHTLMLGVFVKTGGLLSVGELAAQGLVSPFVAKVSTQLVSSGEAAEVEKRLGEFFAERMAATLAPVVTQLQERIATLRTQLPSRDDWEQAVRTWDGVAHAP